jgi:hypothetical protein
MSKLFAILAAALVVAACQPYDFDVNGTADLAYIDQQGVWYRVGDGELFTPVGGEDGSVAVAGDYDGDDVWEPATWTEEGWETDGPAGTLDFVPWEDPAVTCFEEMVAVPADYDGDGATEPAAWFGCDATWVIDGQTTHQFGLSSAATSDETYDVPMPADYDGDGDDDIAVYRPTDGTFHVEGSGQIADLPLGTPMAADFDNDGNDDPAVYRATDGRWYVAGAPAPFGPHPGFRSSTNTVLPIPAQYTGNGAADVALWFFDDGSIALPDGSVAATGDDSNRPGAGRHGVMFSLVRLLYLEECDVDPGSCSP